MNQSTIEESQHNVPIWHRSIWNWNFTYKRNKRIRERNYYSNDADYIKGVINLRGNVVPIIDLPERLGRERV